MAALSPGMRVTDSIRLVRQLDQGGMGSVWVARHSTLRADVVVKFLAPHLADDRAAAARFANEAEAIARVRSPHIVQVLDHGHLSDGPPFIVMELLEGEDLRAKLARDKTLPLAETVRIVAEVAQALARAHERGIVHRDIKPANIFLCDVGASSPFVKVLDFGVAKADSFGGDAKTESGAIVGTPTYMSPEQLVASHVDHRADGWALAAVAFRALTGAPPFRGDSIGALALAIHAGAAPSACAVIPTLPAAVDAWFAKALRVDPNERFQSVTEMAAELVAAAREGDDARGRQPTPAAPAPPARPPKDLPTTTTIVDPMTPRRAPRLARSAVLVVGAGFIGLGVGGVFVAQRASKSATPTAAPSALGSADAARPAPLEVAEPLAPPPSALPTTPSAALAPRPPPSSPRARPDSRKVRERDIE